MGHTPFITRPANGGTQRVYKFDNGYGASVVNHCFSYGTELGVLRFDGDDFDLCYTTPITDDVIGHLSEEGVESVLDLIQALPVYSLDEEARVAAVKKREAIEERIKELELELIALKAKLIEPDQPLIP